jgi:thiosulfate dehydrogenase
MQKKLMSITFASLLSVNGTIPNLVIADTSEDYSIARGGRLYDKWYKESTEANAPNTPNPSYPKGGAYHGKKSSDWRCKECHGWDYLGVEGAYVSGKHHTGIKGVRGKEGAAIEEIIAILKDSNHGYGNTSLAEQDYRDLALFVSKGQIDMSVYINSETKSGKGDITKGKGYYETICANCHGLDGMLDDQMPPMGKLANENPWEVIHKLMNGQPKEEMPALRAFNPQVAADILTYTQSLPKE